MSSAISTRTTAAAGRARAAGPSTRPDDQETSSAQNADGFRVWHFFVLLSLVAATAAVAISRQNTPEQLVLISLTVGAAGAAAFGVYRMLAPLATPESELISEPVSDRLRAHLEREKALTLRTIKELEFDKAMGKVSQQDFDEMAGRLRTRAIGIMRQLDDGGRSAYRALIEREVASRIGQSPAPVESPAAVASAPADPRCTCGVVNDPDARFCKSCGSRLS
jgi:hypothetical protein